MVAVVGAACLGGCDESAAEVVVDAKPVEVPAPEPFLASYTVEAADLNLEATIEVLERNDIQDAEHLEVVINAEDSPIAVDVDHDGARDFVQVHELEVHTEQPAHLRTATFELRAVASSSVGAAVATAFVPVATLDFRMDAAAEVVIVEGRYAPVVVGVHHAHPVVRTISFQAPSVHVHHQSEVVVAAPFFAWVWLGTRPVYVGHVHFPPGHAKKMGLSWHVHHPHGGFKFHGKGPPGHHGSFKVKAKGPGHHGSFKAKAKGPGHHGSFKAKAKGPGHHGSFKAHAKGSASHGRGAKAGKGRH